MFPRGQMAPRQTFRILVGTFHRPKYFMPGMTKVSINKSVTIARGKNKTLQYQEKLQERKEIPMILMLSAVRDPAPQGSDQRAL